jgi:Cu(I)-responsive transcriptional regulator
LIGEAAVRCGVPSKTIRYYEDIGLIEPAERTESHYRAYDDKDIQTLRFIHRARKLGFSLQQVRDLLALYRDRHRASKDVKKLALEHVASIDSKIAELASIRNTIADLARRCHGDKRPDCPIIEDLQDDPK